MAKTPIEPTRMVCPSGSLLATISEEPPATNGMITRIGLDGKGCACTAQLKSAATTSVAPRDSKSIACLLRRGRQFRLRTMRTLTAVLAWLVLSASQAQTYPAKPVRIIVPYAAGGTSDILARQLRPKLSDAW